MKILDDYKYFETENGILYNGDCLEIMPLLQPESIDLVLTDPPYGTTACNWDTIIPIESMWGQLKNLIKENTAVLLFGTEPFSSFLRTYNIEMFKYDWIWEKTEATGFLNVTKIPLRAHEIISVFYKKLPVYNPIKTKGHLLKKSRKASDKTEIYGRQDKPTEYCSSERYPRSVVKLATDKRKGKLHPTQKPIALIEYLIKTYTNKGDTVLDFTIGSGTTAVACEGLGRKWIGIEKEIKYCDVVLNRINSGIQRELVI